MSEALVRAQIVSIMQGVAGIGIVHDYERWTRSLAEFITFMTLSGHVNGWMVHRQSTPAAYDTVASLRLTHTYKISGIGELDDANASERTWQALTEAIFAAFKSNITLNGAALRHLQIQIDNVDTMDYGSRLFHTAELSLVVEEKVMV
ncbi:MAG: hypothetical protein ABSG75_11135 [Syntrophales bacterium]|jgi:hypothetical protein